MATNPKRSGNPAVRAAAIDLDLDAAREARAAKREGKGDLVVRLGGQDFTMPAEMPLNFAYAMTQMDVPTAAKALFGEQAEDFLATGPTIGDLEALVGVYGIDMGERSASLPFSIPSGQS